jgi:hypothetical protein
MTPKQDADVEKRRLAEEYVRKDPTAIFNNVIDAEIKAFQAGYDAGRASVKAEVLGLLMRRLCGLA